MMALSPFYDDEDRDLARDDWDQEPPLSVDEMRMLDSEDEQERREEAENGPC